MTTTVNIDLSSQLATTLEGSDSTYAYAFAFGASTADGSPTLVSTATLVSAGQVQSGASLSLPSPNFYSGVIYVVIQQGGDGTLPSTISSSADIIDNAASGNYSYQMFEATLSGSEFDLGDISAVNTFGITSTYEVVYQDGSDSRGFNTSASDIFGALPADAVADYSPNSFTDPQQLATGPATANNQSPWPSSSWQAYVDALKNNPEMLADIEIVYSFQGSALQPDAMLSQYSVQYVDPPTGEDYFWLVPDTSNGATNTDWIRIPVSQLVDNIFVQSGKLEVHKGGQHGEVVYYDSFTPDNAVGGVAKHFVAGFDAGFWGGSGTSPNALDTTTIDFNKGYNWNVNYAYDAALLDKLGGTSFTNSLQPAVPASGDLYFDPWAQQFVSYSNAYGYSYSDLISAGGINPQISLYDAKTGQNVTQINLTLFDTGETPSSGFQKASTGWIAPAAGGYEAATTPNTNQIGFDFNFSVGSTMYAPDENTPIKLKIYAPQDAQAGSDGFISLDVTGANGNWYYYILDNSSGQWAFQVSNPTGQHGFFNIQNLPGTADGSVGWYQLVFGEGEDQSIYNIYATTGVGGGITDLVVDHGIAVTYYEGDGAYTLDFAPGGHMFYDIDTFSPPSQDDPTSEGVTIVGTRNDDVVNALQTVAGQQNPSSGADTIFGGMGNDQLSGLGGNDVIDGGKGIDFLRGGDGDDILQVRGKEGVFDTFAGGSGTDTLQFIGKEMVKLNGFDAAASSIEILDGNRHGMQGTDRADVFDLSGLSNMQNLRFIEGKDGDDSLIGSAFKDRLMGGDGDDILDGRGGDDALQGGSGHNKYVFSDGYGFDTVLRYNAGKDMFDLSGISGASSFDDITLTQIDRRTVQISFEGIDDTLTVHQATVGLLAEHQSDFLFG